MFIAFYSEEENAFRKEKRTWVLFKQGKEKVFEV